MDRLPSIDFELQRYGLASLVTGGSSMARNPAFLVGDHPHIRRIGSLFWNQADVAGMIHCLLPVGYAQFPENR